MKNKNRILIYSISIMVMILGFSNSCKKPEDIIPTISIPVLSISTVTSITFYSATCGGNITSGGGSAITVKGVCWSTNPSFTVDNSNKTTDGADIGSYTSYITGLNPNTTYYIRSYAINSTGTGYGNLLSFTTLYTQQIGDSYQGGILAYILQPGDPGYITGQTHGLIAAPSDQGTAEWGCSGTFITGADGTAIGTGAQNTIEIIAGCTTAGIAAKLCYDLVLGGYSDWYLPSRDELNKLYLNKAAIGGFASYGYWSSSEFSSNFAWEQFFNDGVQSSTNFKSTATYVRAVRAF